MTLGPKVNVLAIHANPMTTTRSAKANPAQRARSPSSFAIVCFADAQGRLDPDWVNELKVTWPDADCYAPKHCADIQKLKSLPHPLPQTPKEWESLAKAIDQPLLVLRSGVQWPAHFNARLEQLLKDDQAPGMVAFSSNADPAINPLTGLEGTFAADGIDSLLWHVTEGGYSWMEPSLAHTVSAALIQPGRSEPKLAQSANDWALIDWIFIYDPSAPLCSEGSLSPLGVAALGTTRSRIEALNEEGYCDLPYVGLDGRTVTLHVSHDWGGGIARWIHDFKQHDADGHHLVLAACAPPDTRLFGQSLVVYADGPGHAPTQRWALDPVIADTALTHEGYEAFLQWLIRRFGIGRILVSSLIGHSLDCLRQTVPTAQILHDFYPASPVLDTDPLDYVHADGLDLDQLINEHSKTFKFEITQPNHWATLRQDWYQAILSHQVGLMAPSGHVAQRWQALFDRPLLDIQVIPHGFEAPLTWSDAGYTHQPTVNADRPLHLVIVGRLSAGKGLMRLMRVAQAVGQGIRFTVVGGGHEAMRLYGMANVDVILDYTSAELPHLLNTLKPDGALFLSRVPETWNYVLSELRYFKMPVIAPRLGSFEERIEDGCTGQLYTPSDEGLIECLQALSNDPGAWPCEVPSESSMEAMIEAYNAALMPRPMGAQITVAPEKSKRVLSEQYEINRIGTQISERNKAEIANLHQKITQQSELLSQLDRTIKERTQWALTIDRDLHDRNHELQAQQAANQALMESLESLQNQLSDAVRLEQSLRLAESEVNRLQSHLAEEQSRLEQLSATLDQERSRIEQLDAHLGEILSSRSWRLTRPLRVMVRILSAIHHRRAWHPGNWLRQGKRLIHALRVHGWRSTFEALQYHRPLDAPLPVEIPPIDGPDLEATPAPIDLGLDESQSVQVSIIIPVHNKLAYTAMCLESIQAHPSDHPFEVIVVDDASTDETPNYLSQCQGLRVISNEDNLGFIGSCNAGANAAVGDYLVFLNNDTQVTDGWLSALLAPLIEDSGIGISGGRLVYPDGRLQEAGGIIFSDGSGWNYGRLGQPNIAKAQFLSDTDYVSGACLAIRKRLFDELGGFDMHYAPAYYEDTDLCFKTWAKGLRVVYQPRATIIHFEGITSGTSESSGIKQFQAVNREKFRARWHDTLTHHPEPVPGPQATTLIEQARHHRALGHVLVVDAVTPKPDHDSGSVRMRAILELLVELGYRVSFMPMNLAWDGAYSRALEDRGIEVIRYPETSTPKSWLQTHGEILDWVIGSRYYILDDILNDIRSHCPKARIIFDTVDLHFLREERKALLEGDEGMQKASEKTKQAELNLIESVDATWVVSSVEQDLLNSLVPNATIEILSNIHEIVEPIAPHNQRSGIVFVGGFQHPPNVDAAHWLIDEILPQLYAEDPEIAVHLIGSRMPESLASIRQPGLRNHGFVEDIEPFLKQSLVAVAPLRYGAGVKGKVNQAMAYGLPVIATTCAAEGMYVTDGVDILIADDTEAFVAQILKLKHDADLWSRLSKHGQMNVEQHFSRQAARQVLQSRLAESSGG